MEANPQFQRRSGFGDLSGPGRRCNRFYFRRLFRLGQGGPPITVRRGGGGTEYPVHITISYTDTNDVAPDQDTDNDCMPDGFEVAAGFDPNDPADGALDFDSNGRTNCAEYRFERDFGFAGAYSNANMDSDGVLDGAEPLWTSDTDGDGLEPGWDQDGDGVVNALDVDSDNDGPPDGWIDGWAYTPSNMSWGATGTTNGMQEDGEFGDRNLNGMVDPGETDPRVPDSDDEGLEDGEEIVLGTDPLNADTDGDKLNDSDEVVGWTVNVTVESSNDPTNSPTYASMSYDITSDPLVPDADEDGLIDSDEMEEGTDPHLSDTDLEGLGDLEEARHFCLDPTNADTDGDLLSDFDEGIARPIFVYHERTGEGIDERSIPEVRIFLQ